MMGVGRLEIVSQEVVEPIDYHEVTFGKSLMMEGWTIRSSSSSAMRILKTGMESIWGTRCLRFYLLGLGRRIRDFHSQSIAFWCRLNGDHVFLLQ